MKNSIVIQLQKDALDRSIKITDLLRKAYLVAKKLKIQEMQNWINKEFNGFENSADAPSYREIHGTIMAYNPYSKSWIPFMFSNPKDTKIFSRRVCGQPLAEIENMLETLDSNSQIEMPFSPEVEKDLRDSQHPKFDFRTTLHVQPSSLARIVDSVRNAVLNWALKLEEDRILGDEISFSDEEISLATKHNYNINIFFGDVSETQIQQQTQNAKQTLKKDK